MLLKSIVFDALEAFRDNDFQAVAAWFTDEVLYVSKAVNEHQGDQHGFARLLGSYTVMGQQQALSAMQLFSRDFRFERYEVIDVIADESKAATRCSWRVRAHADNSTTDGESYQWWYFQGNRIDRVETIAFYQRRIGAVT